MLKCNFCNREVKNQGAKNLHERACTKNPANNENKNENKVISSPTHEHKFILLNPNISTHRKAIADGFNIYCTICNELE